MPTCRCLPSPCADSTLRATLFAPTNNALKTLAAAMNVEFAQLLEDEELLKEVLPH